MSIKISIIGAAGTLGSCTAYRLATEGLADELVMIDVNRNMLKSHILEESAAYLQGITAEMEKNIKK